jgi:hypothetical protein
MSMLKNPELGKKLRPVFEKGPETKIHDGDFKRSTLVKEVEKDSSDTSSLDSEEEQIHRELEKLIKESKKLTEPVKAESSSSSGSSSLSRSSSSSRSPTP